MQLDGYEVGPDPERRRRWHSRLAEAGGFSILESLRRSSHQSRRQVQSINFLFVEVNNHAIVDQVGEDEAARGCSADVVELRAKIVSNDRSSARGGQWQHGVGEALNQGIVVIVVPMHTAA